MLTLDILKDFEAIFQYIGIYVLKQDYELKVYLPPGDVHHMTIEANDADDETKLTLTELKTGEVINYFLNKEDSLYNKAKYPIIKDITQKLSKWYPNTKDPYVPNGRFTVTLTVSGDIKTALEIARYTYQDLDFKDAIERYIRESLSGKLDSELRCKTYIEVLGSKYSDKIE